MSTVYLAKDLRLNRNIALKILHPHLATDDAFIQRLQREAWSAASLSHPHVVQIHDHGVSADHAYLVLEFIDGQTLREVIADHGPLTPRAALQFLDPVVEGLAAAHAAGLVHRDVKPENVLISQNGWVKIGDFGLSRAVTTTTNTGTLLGTVGYIAPELVNGQGGDARSDIYSVGIMLYELLTGSQPFTAPTPIAVAMSHVRDAIPLPSAKIPDLPSEMDELVSYLTEKNPDNRPSDGSVLLEDLRHIARTLSKEELDAGGSGSVPGLAPRMPRRPQLPPQSAGAQTQALGTAAAVTEAVAMHHGTELTQRFGGNVADSTAALPTAAADLTSVIPADTHATSVLPAGNRLYANNMSDDAQDQGVSTLSPSKREQRIAARENAKLAAKPSKQLGSKHPRRKALAWIIVVAILLSAAAAGGWYLGLGPGALATVPDSYNQPLNQVKDSLQAAGFDSTTTTDVFDEKVAAGFVVGTDPSQGQSARKFVSIGINVSKGPVLYPVPTLTSKKLDDAKSDIITAQLAVGKVSQSYNEKITAGLVISQNPAAGKTFRAKTPVDLVVSQGPKPIPVPSVVGKTLAEAKTTLQAAGLELLQNPEQVFSASVPAGSIVSQSPVNTTVPKGSKVNVTLSKGPEMVMVPDLVGKQVGAATTTLKNLGFEVKVEEILGGFFGTVRFQDPQNTQAPKGSTVTLRVI